MILACEVRWCNFCFPLTHWRIGLMAHSFWLLATFDASLWHYGLIVIDLKDYRLQLDNLTWRDSTWNLSICKKKNLSPGAQCVDQTAMKRPHSELSCHSGSTSETYDLDTGLPRSQAAQASACSIFEYEPHASPIPKSSSRVEEHTSPSHLFSAEQRAAAHESHEQEQSEARSRSQQTPNQTGI